MLQAFEGSETLMRTRSLLFLAFACLILSPPFQIQTFAGAAASPTAFVLTIQDDLISLTAKDASLKAIFEEIGRRLSIRVTVEIPASAKVTLAFERLALPEVLKRLGRYVNYSYIESREKGLGRISAITVHSLKVASSPSKPGVETSAEPSQGQEEAYEQAPREHALEVEIDPAKYLPQKPQ